MAKIRRGAEGGMPQNLSIIETVAHDLGHDLGTDG